MIDSLRKESPIEFMALLGISEDSQGIKKVRIDQWKVDGKENEITFKIRNTRLTIFKYYK